MNIFSLTQLLLIPTLSQEFHVLIGQGEEIVLLNGKSLISVAFKWSVEIY